MPFTDERFDLMASCFSLGNLMDAASKCYKGVGWKRQAQGFMNRKLTNCRKLQLEVLGGTYEPTEVRRFDIVERGKPRSIKPVAFRDRVVQRCLCDQVLTPAIKRAVIEDNSSCLGGRGLSYAYDRVRAHLAACPADGWALQYDFHDYFHTVDRERLLSMLHGLVPSERMIGLVEKVIREDSPGLELGSHVSQLCAVLYPTGLDVAVSSAPGVAGYHRYMDDGIAFCESREAAMGALSVLRESADSLGLALNEGKTHIERATHPLVFCKARFEKTSDGARMNMRKRQTHRAVRHARSVAKRAETHPEIDLAPVEAALAGYVNKGDADLSWLVGRAFED